MAEPSPSRSYVQKVVAAVGIVITAFLLLAAVWYALSFLMLMFAGMLVGVLLSGSADLMRRVVPIPYKIGVGIAFVFLFGLVSIFFWYAGPAVVSQAGDLGEAIVSALAALEEWVEGFDWGESVLDEVPSVQTLWERIGAAGVLGHVTGIASTVVGVLFDIFIVCFVGIYLALKPGVYVDNIVRLFPKDRRAGVKEAFVRSGRALKLWLIGQFVSMAFVAVFVMIGLSLLGVPMALVLGVLSFVLGFIPYLGPILAAIPALLVAFLVGPEMVLYVAILYFILENVQSYVVIPLIQEAVVSLPPVLLIAVQLLFAGFGGILGIALAAPIAVVAVVFIQVLYVREALCDDVTVIGSRDDGG